MRLIPHKKLQFNKFSRDTANIKKIFQNINLCKLSTELDHAISIILTEIKNYDINLKHISLFKYTIIFWNLTFPIYIRRFE